MAIEVKVNEKVQSKFPKLMTNLSGSLLLLVSKLEDLRYHGVVIKSNGLHKVGTHRTDWLNNRFIDYNGEITLKNK